MTYRKVEIEPMKLEVPYHRERSREEIQEATEGEDCLDTKVESHARWLRMASLARAIKELAEETNSGGVRNLAIKLVEEIEAGSPGVFDSASHIANGGGRRRPLEDLGRTADAIFLEVEEEEVYR